MQVEKKDEGKRIDLFLSEQEELEVSRSYAKTLIDDGNVLINSKKTKASYKLKENDLLSIDLPAAQELEIEAENIPLDIVFEDDDLLVINKPIHMITHPAPGVDSGTLVNAILHHCKGQLSNINGVLRPGIVHRLDKDTSGLIVVAKTNTAHQNLAKQLEDRTCSRTYLALCLNQPQKSSGTINKAIGRHPKERHKMYAFNSIEESSNARHAITHWKLLETFRHSERTFSLIEAKLETGRTHQIRVHLASISCPILGDSTYSNQKKLSFKAERPMLHAQKLSFKHPISGKELSFETKLEQGFQRILKLLS